MLDRSFGGSTMVMHVEGATPPNTPAHVEYLKALVCLPPRVIQALGESDKAIIADLVQQFIHIIGVPTVLNFKNAASEMGWTYSTGSSFTPQPYTNNRPTIPQPLPRSNHFYFRGYLSNPASHLSNSAGRSSNSAGRPSNSAGRSSNSAGRSSNPASNEKAPDDIPFQRYIDENLILKQLLEESDAKVAQLQGVVACLESRINAIQSNRTPVHNNVTPSRVVHFYDSINFH